jgi:16S rRNA (uracil1498-N3)-methyltransferase
VSQFWAWVEDLAESGPLELCSEEVRHAASRRLRVGDELVVFDARGRLASAKLEGLGRGFARLEVGAIRSVPAPDSGFGLATAIPRAERLLTMLQMWTQLGLEIWQPLVLEHSVVRRLDVEAPRLQRILTEGCKVAKRPWALQVLPPLGLEQAISDCEAGMALYYGDREAGRADFELSSGRVFIGPEAGFSSVEREALQAAGASALRFAPYNLRIETAAVAAMVAFNVIGTRACEASL